jgi:protein phosphatase
MIPAGRRLRVVGDVHGDAKAFAIAADTDRFVVQLGDLVDDGPDTPGALDIMFGLIDAGNGMFLLGNHDFKLARALRGDDVHGVALQRTLAELSPAQKARALTEIIAAPGWISTRHAFFVHGAYHRAMPHEAVPPFPASRPDGLLARALYGQTSGRVMGGGKPERLLRWVDDIRPGVTVYCGHDRRSSDGRPYVRSNEAGGKAIFMDTGAGKGGHLSWMDIDPI